MATPFGTTHQRIALCERRVRALYKWADENGIDKKMRLPDDVYNAAQAYLSMLRDEDEALLESWSNV